MSVDFPAPLGPSKPNIPCGISSETSLSARVPFGYVFERCSIRSSIRLGERDSPCATTSRVHSSAWLARGAENEYVRQTTELHRHGQPPRPYSFPCIFALDHRRCLVLRLSLCSVRLPWQDVDSSSARRR